MLGRKVGERLGSVRPAELWSGEVRELCAGCDALVLNLECCISERGEPTPLISGKPFFFRAPPAAVETLRAVGATAASAANNHALDFGAEALEDTVRELRDAGIAPAGAGPEASSARRGALVEAAGVRVGVLALSDHPREFAAGPEQWGVAFADLRRELPEWVCTELGRLRAEADLVVAFPHWGPNMTVRPAPWQRERARELLEAGADAVAGHSSHVFHGVELADGGPVLYDLGDALDDYAVDPQLRNDLGLLAVWRPGGEPPLELVGLFLDYCRTELARGPDADWIADRVEGACAELGTAVERTAEQRFAIGG
jgi:poly-gamma-glutamate capsule biosynthesis protein CapA/YwtB (metallophosphatase superfamily)